MRHLGSLVFFAGMAISAGAIWSLSASKWGKEEQFVVTGRDQRKFGDPTFTPMLGLSALRGAQRQPLAVPKDVYDDVLENDQLQIRTRMIPFLAGELIQYSLVRAGSTVKAWDEGWPFYGFAMFVASFAGGALLFAVFRYLAAVFRLKAPSED
jgi:hypothetical protein